MIMVASADDSAETRRLLKLMNLWALTGSREKCSMNKLNPERDVFKEQPDDRLTMMAVCCATGRIKPTNENS